MGEEGSKVLLMFVASGCLSLVTHFLWLFLYENIIRMVPLENKFQWEVCKYYKPALVIL